MKRERGTAGDRDRRRATAGERGSTFFPRAPSRCWPWPRICQDLSGSHGRPRSAPQRRRRARERQHPVEVDVREHRLAQRLDRAQRAGLALDRRHEPEVALRRGDAIVAPQRADHRHAERLDRLAQQLDVVVGADLVDDDARDLDVGIERAVAVDDRRRAARHRGGVDHEQDRGVQQLRDVRRRGQLAAARRAVEQPHDALDHRDVRARGAVQEQRRDELRPGQERVEVAARAPGRQRVVAGVDVVRPDLEALHDLPARAQRRDEPAGDGGLARARARPRDDDARDRHREHRPSGSTPATNEQWRAVTTRCPAVRGCRRPSGA